MKVKYKLLEALPSTQLNSFNSLAQVDNLPCVHYLHGHNLWTLPETRGHRGEGIKTCVANSILLTHGGHCFAVEPVMRTMGWDWGRGEALGREGVGIQMGLASNLRQSFRNLTKHILKVI